MKVVFEKPVLERIYDIVQAAQGKPPVEILLSPAETLDLKKDIWSMLSRKWHTNPGLPPGLRLFGVPIKVDEAVVT